MENIVENQASNQSTAPAAGAESAPPAQPPMTPEMQAAMAELGQMQNNPDALQANAEKYGMGQEWKDLTAKMQQMAVQNQALVQKQNELQKQLGDLIQRDKGSKIKSFIVSAVGAVIGSFGMSKILKDKNLGNYPALKRMGSYFAAGVAGSIVFGYVGNKIFGSKEIQDEAKNIMLQGQQTEVALEQIPQMMQQAQEPTIMALVTKMAEAKKQAPTAAPNVEPPLAGVAPVAPPSVAAPAPGASSQSLGDDKVGDQSIKLSQESVANAPAAVSSQSTMIGGVQPRGSHTGAAVAAKEQLVGAAATR
jgi:hypothetical protein